ncbi:MAG: (2Fe-2S)-binding protein, partial [Candidatus Krumholzibacteria bacterium]|nr:(2Fe-2S)-binding protein [Candidatus Krumholzibacteria bacterium]
VEGVQAEARALGKFLVGEGADQCGFCSPGLVLSVLAMQQELGSDRIPDDEEIRHYLAGNLCRCTGYVAQLRGIKNFLEVTR